MKVAMYSVKHYEKPFFQALSQEHTFYFIEKPLNAQTATLAQGCLAVCVFVTDILDAEVLKILQREGVQLIALRSTGYDHVDLAAAKQYQLTVVHVPAYSPQAVAEFAVGLILCLTRKILRAHDRIRAHNFSLEDQMGYNLQGRTVGVVGTGNIGTVFAKIMLGFDCRVIAYDPIVNRHCESLGVRYVSLPALFQQSDIISLHCVLNSFTKHMINSAAIAAMKEQVVLINTARGGLVDTAAVIQGLNEKKIAALGIDVYEYERELYFKDHSNEALSDSLFTRLQTFPNVVITGHQAYLTEEALANIAKTTEDNLTGFACGAVINQLVG